MIKGTAFLLAHVLKDSEGLTSMKVANVYLVAKTLPTALMFLVLVSLPVSVHAYTPEQLRIIIAKVQDARIVSENQEKQPPPMLISGSVRVF